MTRYRWTGISAPFGGLQWERKDDDREIARRVLNLLSDRRMLWKDFSLEIEEHCVTSANKIRDQLGEQMNNPEIGTDLARRLQLLQRLFRDFVDHIGPASSDTTSGMANRIAIVPDQAGWFFEPFDSTEDPDTQESRL